MIKILLVGDFNINRDDLTGRFASEFLRICESLTWFRINFRMYCPLLIVHAMDHVSSIRAMSKEAQAYDDTLEGRKNQAIISSFSSLFLLDRTSPT